MNNKIRVYAFKYFSYTAILLCLFVLQSTPDFLSFGGVKPILVIPACVCIAMVDGEFIGGIFGAVAGVLCDLGSLALFGFNSIVILICCICIGLLVIYLMRLNLVNAVLLTVSTLTIRGLLDYFVTYAMWGYENSSLIIFTGIIPCILLTAVFTPPIFFLIKKFKLYLDIKLDV